MFRSQPCGPCRKSASTCSRLPVWTPRGAGPCLLKALQGGDPFAAGGRRQEKETDMGFEDDFKQLVQEASENMFRNAADLAERAKVSPSALSQLLSGKRKGLQLETVARLLDAIGVNLVRPWEQGRGREVCFADARVVRAEGDGPPPVAGEYLAVPVVDEAGAVPGAAAKEEVRSWLLVDRSLRSLAPHDDYLAVLVGRNSRAMAPLLQPGDMALVDLKDRGELAGYAPPGNIYLVREPGREVGGVIRRVALSGGGLNTILTYYGENHDPEPHFLYRDFAGELSRAVLGRVIWAWTDMGRK